eukprot:GHVP01013309.1.p1 GENE.GHVP01013309.1~~GHVP01013309.1.p1  ORF type:complete len:103 (-),score=10.63 GHVP01013309.1:150-458(-)
MHQNDHKTIMKCIKMTIKRIIKCKYAKEFAVPNSEKSYSNVASSKSSQASQSGYVPSPSGYVPSNPKTDPRRSLNWKLNANAEKEDTRESVLNSTIEPYLTN